MAESDLISRQAVIDKFKSIITDREYTNITDEAKERMARKFFADIPSSAQPEQRWIPCSEKLPEEFDVLCCDNYGEMLIANPFECDDSDTGFSAESDECYMYNCIAWMPLPEPYQEGEQNG